MKDITTMSTMELENDLAESILDKNRCIKAMSVGIFSYGPGKLVNDRLNDNKHFIIKIGDELKRRGVL